jgi:hypothetical protein
LLNPDIKPRSLDVDLIKIGGKRREQKEREWITGCEIEKEQR